MQQHVIDDHNHKCEAAKLLLRNDGHVGPWNDEKNRLNWKHAGLDCMIVRHDSLLHLCGYVGVPKSHPAFGKDYDGVPVDVHGGLTYSKQCSDAVCHISDDEEVWWLGFDCAHFDDFSPSLFRFYGPLHGQSYKAVEFVQKETNNLAEQLAEFTK